MKESCNRKDSQHDINLQLIKNLKLNFHANLTLCIASNSHTTTS